MTTDFEIIFCGIQQYHWKHKKLKQNYLEGPSASKAGSGCLRRRPTQRADNAVGAGLYEALLFHAISNDKTNNDENWVTGSVDAFVGKCIYQ